jgi:hypothetical protein
MVLRETITAKDNWYEGSNDHQETDRDHVANTPNLRNLKLGPSGNTDEGAKTDKDATKKSIVCIIYRLHRGLTLHSCSLQINHATVITTLPLFRPVST